MCPVAALLQFLRTGRGRHLLRQRFGGDTHAGSTTVSAVSDRRHWSFNWIIAANSSGMSISSKAHRNLGRQAPTRLLSVQTKNRAIGGKLTGLQEEGRRPHATHFKDNDKHSYDICTWFLSPLGACNWDGTWPLHDPFLRTHNSLKNLHSIPPIRRTCRNVTCYSSVTITVLQLQAEQQGALANYSVSHKTLTSQNTCTLAEQWTTTLHEVVVWLGVN